MLRAVSIKKKLREAGVPMDELEIRSGEIEIRAGYREIDRYGDGTSVYGECDEKKVSELHAKIAKVLPNYSAGYKTGYGATILPEGYQIDNMGDWNDPGSKWHY